MSPEEEASTRRLVGKGDDEAIAEINAKIVKYNGIAGAEGIMNKYLVAAKDALSHYPDSPYRTALDGMCDFLAQRKK
jgi:geranylgeranyl pyrophosphate synthase